MNLVIAASLWILFALFSLRARSRGRNTFQWATLLLAVSMTLNVDSIYTSFDALMPIGNLGNLLANGTMITGLFLVLRAVREGTRSTDRRGQSQWDMWALIATLVIMVSSFTLLDAPQTSTTFMLDFGDQLATAIYSSVQFVFIGSVMIYTGAVLAKSAPYLRSGRYRVGMRVLVFGCFIGVALSVSVLTMNVLHLAGELALMRTIGSVHDVLRLLTILVLAIGFAIPALLRQRMNWKRRKQVQAAAEEVYRIWVDTGVPESEQATAHQSLAGRTTREISNRVHRMIIEIHDWANLNAAEESLESHQWRQIDEAERLCLHVSER